MGGAERQAILLAYLINNFTNARSTVVALEEHRNKVSDLCKQLNINHIGFEFIGRTRFLRFLQSLLRLIFFLRKLQPNILMPYTMFPNIISGLIWKFTGAQTTIWNQRNAGLPFCRLPWQFIEKISIINTPAFISNSTEGVTFLNKNLHIQSNKISLIHNALYPELFIKSGHFNENIKLPKHDFSACMVGNLHKNKDHSTLIMAWKIVVEQLEKIGLTAILLLAGRPGDTFNQIVELIKKLKLENNVILLGEVADVLTLYHQVDMCVLSSKSEGFPNAILEGMFCGLSVVATDLEGIKELITHENHEYLAKIGDDKQLANNIIYLARDELLRNRIGQLNRERMLQHFIPETLLRNTIQVINRSMPKDSVSKIYLENLDKLTTQVKQSFHFSP